VNTDDTRLISDCLAGRTAAFGELVYKYQDRLYNTVFRLVNNPDDAREVVQEAFLLAFQSLANFKGGSQFFTWLYRIAINTAITQKRKQKVVLRLYEGPENKNTSELADPSETNHPGHALEMAEQESQVHHALAQLSPEHRVVLVMKDLDGKKYEEMAQILQVPVGTIRSRLHRARLEMRDLLLESENANARNKSPGLGRGPARGKQE
jgi:RNA polymerase sigma-70 factor (ECF subfamily)